MSDQQSTTPAILDRYPAYAPTDRTARAVALRMIDSALRYSWDHGNIRATVARSMNDDGTVDVVLIAESGDLDVDLFGDTNPRARGVAWIRRGVQHDWWPSVWYAFPDQEHTAATIGNADAGGVPVDFGSRYGRDLYGSDEDARVVGEQRDRDIQDGVRHGGERVGDRGYWLGGQFIEVE